jgi:hypothetical protein
MSATSSFSLATSNPRVNIAVPPIYLLHLLLKREEKKKREMEMQDVPPGAKLLHRLVGYSSHYTQPSSNAEPNRGDETLGGWT